MHPVKFGASEDSGKKKYCIFKNAIQNEYKGQKYRDGEDIKVEIKLSIHTSRIGKSKNDLGNFLKLIIDALEAAKALNEYQIVDIHIVRDKVKLVKDREFSLKSSH